MVNGVWESKPQIIKREVLRYFRDKFKENMMRRPKLLCYGLKKLTQQDTEGLITGFSAQEVMRGNCTRLYLSRDLEKLTTPTRQCT